MGCPHFAFCLGRIDPSAGGCVEMRTCNNMEPLVTEKRIHLIGVKGAGMASLAEIYAKQGAFVTGSDTSEKFFTDEILSRLGVEYAESFSPDNIPRDAERIVYSTAYRPETNEELRRALERKDIPVASYPEAVGELTRKRLSILVSGTHGKTTTTALLAEVLRAVGFDPLALVGSRPVGWSGGALVGNGQYFVLEADEYQNKFQYYEPWGAILTSVDWDHPDFFPDENSYRETFRTMIRRIPPQGMLAYCGDSADVASISKECRGRAVSYGFLESNDVCIADYQPLSDGEFRQSFQVSFRDEILGQFRLRLAGRHNALNASAVVAVCLLLGVRMDDNLMEAFENFRGTARRFEYVGTGKHALVYDDYAHHPEEIRATLRAFRELFPDKHIIAVFHPHTFSRTKALLESFAQSFDDADAVIVLDIYGSAREVQGGVSSQDLASLINRYGGGNKAQYISSISEVVLDLSDKIGENDLVVTLGAGNVWEVGKKLVGKSDIQ